MTRVDDLPGAQIDVAGLVVLFNPGLVVFVPYADVQGQVRPNFVVILGVAGDTPLALPYVDAAQGHGGSAHTIKHEVSAPIPACIGQRRIAGECPAVVQRSQIAIVVAGGVVVFVADGLHAEGQRVQPALPRHVIHVAVGVVNDPAIERGCSDTADAAADVLEREAIVGLVGERDAHFGVAAGPELAGWILRQAGVPVGARKADAGGVNQVRRERVHPVSANHFRWEQIYARELDGQHRCRSVVRGGHGIEARNLVGTARVVLNLDVTLVVGLVAPCRPLVVVVHDPIRR